MTNTKTKKSLFIGIVLALILIPCLFLLTACGGDDPRAKADVNNAKVDGITVTVNETTKKTFTEEDGARFTQFGKYGELDQISVTVSGTVSKADCTENATAMDANGNVIEAGSETPVSYYTDFFTLYLLVPEGATQYGVSDGLPAGPVEELGEVKDGYVAVETQWLLNSATDGWQICGNTTTNDGYFYYSFNDAEGEVVEEFFVRVAYDVTFVD